jgi:hypothetical protein
MSKPAAISGSRVYILLYKVLSKYIQLKAAVRDDSLSGFIFLFIVYKPLFFHGVPYNVRHGKCPSIKPVTPGCKTNLKQFSTASMQLFDTVV